ncbi:uncharacterized protein LAJ45_10064 [Morchella importuna]|uniref:uncharacterized protein n=1 Tax=Morchella importuna TaxID=1174673 RepID=UPI001E8DF27E|nr:uncharacterized protein LAJ45_10064 [Morchella importuna]KAH8145922.1 hypothetical protein LAJ45_10064 [Morchella importuna]
MLSDTIYPAPSSAELRKHFLGKHISDLPSPSVILDEAVLKRNCERMLQAPKTFGIDFRAHVKTHKTIELTRLQLGKRRGGKLVVSTVREAEALAPLIKEGVVDDILYGVPLAPSAIPRLSALSSAYPALTISLLIDHPDQLTPLLKSIAPGAKQWPLFIKLDVGSHRAGIEVATEGFKTLLGRIRFLELETTGKVFLKGFYTHAGHSYSATNATEVFTLLSEEIKAGELAMFSANKEFGLPKESSRKWTISVGSTPTALSITTMTKDPESTRTFAQDLGSLDKRCSLEVHAGVYTMLDLQQLSTHAIPEPHSLGVKDIAISVLAEVVSIYPGRGEGGSTEALVAVGTTGLGREPGKEWPGWGAVSDWGMPGAGRTPKESGWVVDKISQEHGVLVEKVKGAGEKLKVGGKVRIWPQHACIASNGHGWYFVVGPDNTVKDVWVRWRGW